MTDNLNQMLEILGLARRIELAAAAFYTVCAGKCRECASFWRDLAIEEEKHANVVTFITEQVLAYPERFVIQVLPPLKEVRLFLRTLKAATRKLALKKTDCFELHKLALELEENIIERHYYYLVTAEDEAYKALVLRLRDETLNHRKKIEAFSCAECPLAIEAKSK